MGIPHHNPQPSRRGAVRALALVGLAASVMALAAVWPDVDEASKPDLPASMVVAGPVVPVPSPAELERERLDQLESRIAEGSASLEEIGALWAEAEDPDVAQASYALLVAQGTADWPDDYRGRFLRRLAPDALLLAREHQVLPSVILSQAVLESGWGRSGLATGHNNLFGIKAGASKKAVRLDTHEHVGGKMRPTRKRFRTFESWGESLGHHARLLGHDRRYADARPLWQDPDAYLRAIAPTYASHPGYPDTLMSIVERYGLDRFDAAVIGAATADEALPVTADGTQDTGVHPAG